MENLNYKVPAFKEFIPNWLRFSILAIIGLLFQFSNAVYLANIKELIGSKGLSFEDVNFIFSAMLVGLSLIFPIQFRLKFRFKPRVLLLLCSTVIIIGNIINIYSSNIIILTISSLFIGIFKIIGTFTCFSNIQLVLTPKRDLAVFFPFIFSIIIGAIYLSGIMTAYISYQYGWKYMPYTIIALHLLIMLVVYFIFGPSRIIKKIPLYKIDWIGIGLWAIALLSLNFIAEYGIILDWFKSEKICYACFLFLSSIGGVVLRMNNIRRPHILIESFKNKKFYFALFLFAILEIFISSSHVIMNTYTERILKFDIINNNSLNLATFIGTISGALFSFYWLAKYRGGYKRIVFISILCLILYHTILFFIISNSIAKEQLYLPCFLLGLGNIILYITIFVYVSRLVHFEHFFSCLGLMAFVHTASGGTVANSLVSYFFEILLKKNMVFIAQNLNSGKLIYNGVFNSYMIKGNTFEQTKAIANNVINEKIFANSFIASSKEMFGYIVLFGIIILMLILIKHIYNEIVKGSAENAI